MQKLQSKSGFTLIEFAITFAIIGILAVFATISMDTFFRRGQARKHTQKIASVLEEARSQAIRQGNNYIVLFDFGAAGQVRVIDDDDNNWQQNGAEVTRLIRWDQGVRAGVTSYGNSATPPAANVVPEDGAGAIPGAGTTFAIDGVSGLPAVGFTPQGIPVALATPTDWSTGAGSYYITDSVNTVYAVTLLPLGGVRVRVYRANNGTWI
jgi:prepilin-type N-terminal cleavage/methylation domain-containing protein